MLCNCFISINFCLHYDGWKRGEFWCSSKIVVMWPLGQILKTIILLVRIKLHTSILFSLIKCEPHALHHSVMDENAVCRCIMHQVATRDEYWGWIWICQMLRELINVLLPIVKGNFNGPLHKKMDLFSPERSGFGSEVFEFHNFKVKLF